MSPHKLYSVPDSMVESYKKRRVLDCYRYDSPLAVEIPLHGLKAPMIGPSTRGLDEHRLRYVVTKLENGEVQEPVIGFQEPAIAVLLDGAHRYFVSLAVGFIRIPVLLIPLDDAEVRFGYAVQSI